MPPSSRRTRNRREANLQQQHQDHSDGDTPESIQTPTRKRRRVNAPAEPNRLTQPATTGRRTASAQSAQSASTVDAAEGSDNEDHPPSLEALVVSKLKVASYAANATRDYDNSVIEQTNPGTRTAYAKIAGHNWTFFVVRESVTIGRPERAGSEHPEHSAAGTHTEDGQDGSDKYTGPKAETEVDIDLGPDRSVSRIHAMIYYDGDRRKWLIRCNGRNGLKLDDNIIHRGAIAELRSGSVISVTGTQMLFILPNVEMELAPVIRTQVGLKSDDESGHLDRDAYLPPRSGPNGENGRGQMTGSSFHDAKDYPAHSPAQHGGHSYNPTSSQAFPATPATKHEYSKTNSPAYARGVKMESTEQIDYSLDANKDVKPPFSYAQIIGQAIVSAPDEQISLNDIYEYMRKNFAFYRWSNEKWPNSIRHNLSLNKAFEKVPRKFDDPGKGNKWTLVKEHRDEFLKKGLTNARRAITRKVDSGPSSPATRPPTQGGASQSNPLGSPLRSQSTRSSTYDNAMHHSITTPPASFPAPQESFTPDRGPRGSSMNGAHPISHATPDRTRPYPVGPPSSTPGPAPSRHATATASFEQPTPLSNKTGLKHASAGYSPTQPTPSQNSSATLYNPPPTSAAGGPEVTPFISRQHPRLAPPSAAVPPSQFMVMSSPAPFWKYADLGSTPARGQTGAGMSSDGVKVEDEDEAPAVEQPSSPPVLRRGAGDDGEDEADGDETVGEGSPSRTVSRPGSRAAPAGLGAGAHRVNGRSPGLGSRSLGLGPLSGSFGASKTTQADDSFAAEDEDDGEGIDLSKGFQTIGSFHRNLSRQQAQSTPTHAAGA